MYESVLLACSLDYPGVGPEHSFLKDEGRAEYYNVTDDEALEGMKLYLILPFKLLSRHGGLWLLVNCLLKLIVRWYITWFFFRMWCCTSFIELLTYKPLTVRNLLVVNLVAWNFGVLINEAKEINQSVESSNVHPSFFNGLACFSVFVFIFFFPVWLIFQFSAAYLSFIVHHLMLLLNLISILLSIDVSSHNVHKIWSL